MNMNVYTSDKTSPRAFQWIWFIRLLQITVSVVVLGITAANIASFHAISCTPPGKLDYNLACAVLALIVLAYFFFATGPRNIFRLLPWFIWGQIALDALMVVIWLAASASSKYNCSDLCGACADASEVYFDDLICTCYSNNNLIQRDTSPAPNGLATSLQTKRSYTSSGGSTIAAKQGLDAIMTVLFAITLAATIFWLLKGRTSGAAAAGPTIITTPAPHVHEEAGGVPLNTGMQQQRPQADPYGNQSAPLYEPAPGMPPHGAQQPGFGTQGMPPQQAAYGSPAGQQQYNHLQTQQGI